MSLSAIAINCTLKPSPHESSCGLLLSQISDEFQSLGIECPIIRAVDFNILPGVTSDKGAGDDWPSIRQQVLDEHPYFGHADMDGAPLQCLPAGYGAPRRISRRAG